MLKLGTTSINKAYLGSTEINKIYLGSSVIYEAISAVLGTPMLFNFRIGGSNPDRVLFDATTDITGMTTTGFAISDKTISSVTIDGDGLGGYFTVSSAFTYWDNPHIRLGEITDGANSQSVLDNFSLTYIENTIPEPSTSLVRYVTASASGGGNGLTEGTAWTVDEAISNSSSNMTIWFKAGNYGNISGKILQVNGTASQPLKWKGYKTSIGDISANYYDYGVSWSTAEMPTFTGTYSNYPVAIGSDYFIMGNFQFDNYVKGIRDISSNKINNATFRRVNFKDHNNFVNNEAAALFLIGGSKIRVEDCVALNSSTANFHIQNSGGNAFIGCKSYNDTTSSTAARTDYHFIFGEGSNNIAYNCYCENFNSTATNQSTHGFNIRAYSAGAACAYNLIENCEAVNVLEGMQFRSNGVNNSVCKDFITSNNNATTKTNETTGGLWFKNAVNNNLYERCLVKDVAWGIGIRGRDEDGGGTSIGSGNIIRNCIFYNTKDVVYSASDRTATATDYKWYNNTFLNATNGWHERGNTNVTISNLDCKNNIIEGVASVDEGSTGFVFDYNNFWSSWTTGVGANDQNIDPNMVSPATGDFTPQAAFASFVAPALVTSDYNSAERDDTSSTIGAVIHADEVISGGGGSYTMGDTDTLWGNTSVTFND